MQNCVVYWLFDSTCTDPFLHGYVGITKHLPRRVWEHRRRFGENFEVKVLFSGTRAECYAEERRLRPEHSVGWNVIAGGLSDRVYPPSVRDKISNGNKGKKRSEAFIENMRAKFTGRKHTLQARATMSASQMGHAVSEELRAKMRANSLGRKQSPEAIAKSVAHRIYTPEYRAKLGAATKGKGKSVEHCAKIGEANKRRVISEETRAKMSAAKKGRPLSQEHRAKMSEARRSFLDERRSETDGQGEIF